MTLKEMLQGRNYEIKHKNADCFIVGTGSYTKAKAANKIYSEFIVQDTDNKQAILEMRDYEGEHYTLAVYGKKQNIAKAVVSHMMDELEKMYAEQELAKQRKRKEEARKKAEEAAKKFEQKKNKVYQNLFNIINPRNM